MPEGPSVKKFQLLCSPYVGKMVSKVGGSTRQINPDDLKTLTLWDIQVRLVLHFDAGSFLVFYNCRIQQCSSPSTDPATDILSLEFDRERALEVLAKDTPVCYMLLNQSYFSGIGNIIKNEALYLARIHPLSLGSSLESTDLKSLLDHVVQFSLAWLHNKLGRQKLQLQIYMKDKCPKGHEVKKATFGPPDGLKRLTWWCPQCQPQVPPEEMDMPLVQGT
ncbi:endonuclease 8-like 2 isoform X2 [Pituophis catenifer annectens]|uniref:endonuclease 8-like 2 isoform X2 n=1 Tax=Pituophis catenifer annectens TaxID=94852 RepID=UPI0039919DF0